ncbi:coniferyl-alcohol dehydrogenase [Haliea sp. E17]|uniref:coniferyl-alcohol dehydrogenase n=1 Tax=Haliea sp. E17 TaxID=3401576 RepID=UPI003AAC4C81
MNALNYKNKHVVVTGCYTGIGNAVAGLLIDLGATVHGVDLHAPDLPLAEFSQLDLRALDAIPRVAEKIASPVDALFNCAGLGPSHPDADVLTINFLATRCLTAALAANMQPGAAIASIASIGGAAWPAHLEALSNCLAIQQQEDFLQWYQSNSALFANAYSFSKEAIVVWTKQQATQLIRRGIRINCTSPGATRTPMLDEIERELPNFSGMDAITRPIGRCSTSLEQAWPLLLLNSELCSYINGADLPVDGGGAALATVGAS